VPTDVATLRRNRLLATVHDQELARFTDMVALREFGKGQVVSEPYEEITEVYFPVDAVFSVVATTADGSQVEAGTIGNEGVANLAPFLGAQSSVLRIMCQIPGTALVADVGRLMARADGAMATAARRYAMTFMTMASQGAACNRLHGVEQRAARWLLMVNDRIDRNPFELTHEFLAIMLGATRPTVTLAAEALRKAGLVEYRRGKVTIIDRPGLERAACECYALITDEYERAIGTPLRATARPN
jgi:CRP-like cAMP-binding protein